MKPYRSMLFVPGNKPGWAEKGIATGADAIILDIEDSVPGSEKDVARKMVRESIERLADQGHRCDIWVRPNSFDSGLFGADAEAVMVPGLAGLFLPKVNNAQEAVRQDAVVSHIEEREGLVQGSVGFLATFETAEGLSNCEDITRATPRVWSILGATGPNADLSRSVGFEFSLEGLESLYLRSRIILAARSAGRDHPVTGVWQDIKDIDGFRTFALDSRRLGFRGMVSIHPSHVAISNEVFTPPADQVDYYRRMIAAFREAEAAGSAAIDFEGRLIDYAHIKTAQEVIDLADAIGAAS